MFLLPTCKAAIGHPLSGFTAQKICKCASSENSLGAVMPVCHVETRRRDIIQRRGEADPKNGNRISATIPAGGSGEQVQLTMRTAEGREPIAAETKTK